MSRKGGYLGGHTTFRVGDPSWGNVDERPREGRAYRPPRSAAEEREFERFNERIKNPPTQWVLIRRDDLVTQKQDMEQLLEASEPASKKHASKKRKKNNTWRGAAKRAAMRRLAKRV